MMNKALKDELGEFIDDCADELMAWKSRELALNPFQTNRKYHKEYVETAYRTKRARLLELSMRLFNEPAE